MPRSRVVVVAVMACALLAALVFGAAAVLGWALAQPIGVVSGMAALTNIALISSPRTQLGRRLALVFGASMLVASVAVGAWGLTTGVPWWLSAMPMLGAVLMVPEVLDLITFPDESKRTATPAPEPETEPVTPLPPLRIEEEREAAQAFFSGPEALLPPTPPGPSSPLLLPMDPAIVPPPSPDREDLMAPDAVEPESPDVLEPEPTAEPAAAEPPPVAVEAEPDTEPQPEPEALPVEAPESEPAALSGAEPAPPLFADEQPDRRPPEFDSDYDDVVTTATRGIPVTWDDDDDDVDEVEITGRHGIIAEGWADEDDDYDDVLDTATRGILPVFDDEDDEVETTGRHAISLDELLDRDPNPRRGRRSW